MDIIVDFFYPEVDDFTLLEVDNSWDKPSDYWGFLLGADLASFQIHVEVNGVKSDYVTVQSNGVQIPYWTITVQLEDGQLNEVAPFVWDNDGGSGCYGGCPDAECLDGFCGVATDMCGEEATDTDCDLKIYVGWYGTDSNGNYMTSASKRLSAFRSWSLVELVRSAAQMAAEIQPDPDALLEQVGGILG